MSALHTSVNAMAAQRANINRFISYNSSKPQKVSNSQNIARLTGRDESGEVNKRGHSSPRGNRSINNLNPGAVNAVHKSVNLNGVEGVGGEEDKSILNLKRNTGHLMNKDETQR